MSEADILKDAKEAFELVSDHESDNRRLSEADLRFSRLGDQWEQQVLRTREQQGRPALTINKLPAFIRQVVNETRQNKHAIKARPVDGGADVETAEIINGLIHNIEVSSNADIAYDTAADFAASMGFGYIRVDVDYAHDDTFDQDIKILRVPNPFSIFGDPHSESLDSSDWNSAFVVSMISKEDFERKYKGAAPVDWEETGYTKLDNAWFDGDRLMLAEWFKREETERPIVKLSNGMVVDRGVYEQRQLEFELVGIQPIAERVVKSHKVTQYLMTGVEILETTDWPGRYIPIVPVYGEEVNVLGKRYFRSLIRDAKDAQRMFNYWRSATTEMIALAPKAPYIGPERAFSGQDTHKWDTANTEAHSYIGYAGDVPPQRQPFAGIPAGALQEALNAADDMKSVMGIYDPSLGARSNETSGIAIRERRQEGDTATFHFPDNLNRAIRQVGSIVIDLIPYVYSGPRIIRTLGEDDETQDVEIGQRNQEAEEQGYARVYDLTLGKYDLVVDTGPAYATRRQEAADQMIEFARAFPAAVPIIGDLLAKNLDWPGADEIAKRLRALIPGVDQEDPRLAQAMQMVQQLQQAIEQLKADRSIEQFEAKVKAMEAEAKQATAAYDAETKRIAALAKAELDITNAMSPPGPYDKHQNSGNSQAGRA